jgi:hypothetical protein
MAARPANFFTRGRTHTEDYYTEEGCRTAWAGFYLLRPPPSHYTAPRQTEVLKFTAARSRGRVIGQVDQKMSVAGKIILLFFKAIPKIFYFYLEACRKRIISAMATRKKIVLPGL